MDSRLDGGQMPPQAVDIEEAVLGAILLQDDCLVRIVGILKPEMFYKPAHQLIYKAILSLFDSGNRVDLLTVKNQLQSTDDLEVAGGSFEISQLTNRVASTANIESHAAIMKGAYIKREIIRIGGTAIREGYDDTTSPLDLLDALSLDIMEISNASARKKAQDIKSIMADVLHDVEMVSANPKAITGIPCGISTIDEMLRGFDPGELIVIAARPGMGKTALLLSMALNMAKDGRKVDVYSMEMTAKQLGYRIASQGSELSYWKLQGGVDPYALERVASAVSAAAKLPLFIDDTPALTITELRSKLMMAKMIRGIDIAFVDYLQLMQGKGQNRESEISAISRGLKAIAKELSIPIVALSQLNRSVETRGGRKKPVLADLRESGAIEQDADKVLMLYRAEYYGFTEDVDGTAITEEDADIIIEKNRTGKTGERRIKWDGTVMRFLDPDSTTFDKSTPRYIPGEEADFNDSQPF